jgi:hypothetical protein
MTKKRTKLDKDTKIIIAVGTILVLFAVYNVVQLSGFNSILNEQAEEQAIASQLPKLSLISLTAQECSSCSPIGPFINQINSLGINITESKIIDFSDEESKDLISKFNVEKLPALILTGELDKSSSLSRKLTELGSRTTNQNEDYFIIESGQPYLETKTGDVRGLLTLTLLTKNDCAECSSIEPLVAQIKQSNVRVKEERTIDADSKEGKAIIKKYSIDLVPSLIVDKELGEYAELAVNWEQVGTVEEDGSYVLRRLTAPYYSLEEKRVVGLTTMTLLRDSSCTECYDAKSFHTPVLKNMGIIPSQETELNYNTVEGKAIATKYNITKLPTLILEGDLASYPAMLQVWPQVGTVEEDGSYVFRVVEIARKPYKDLTTGNVVTPTAQ